jgi:hypothetical protein
MVPSTKMPAAWPMRAAGIFAVVRHLALKPLGQNSVDRGSIATKRCTAHPATIVLHPPTLPC